MEARRLVIAMCRETGQGYAGQGMELADILACIYGSILRRKSDGTLHDRFVLSTGHDAIALFAVLGALGTYDRTELLTYGIDGSHIEESPLSGIRGFEITRRIVGPGSLAGSWNGSWLPNARWGRKGCL